MGPHVLAQIAGSRQREPVDVPQSKPGHLLGLHQRGVLLPERLRFSAQYGPRLIALDVVDREAVDASLNGVRLVRVPADLTDDVALTTSDAGLSRGNGKESLDGENGRRIGIRVLHLLGESLGHVELRVRLDVDVEDRLRDRCAVKMWVGLLYHWRSW